MSSTRTLVTLLRPWIRRFTIIISAWRLRTSSKFTWEEVKTSTGKLGKWSTPKRVRIRPKYSAPSLSRDRRIKMHQSINQSIKITKNAVFALCCEISIAEIRLHSWYENAVTQLHCASTESKSPLRKLRCASEIKKIKTRISRCAFTG